MTKLATRNRGINKTRSSGQGMIEGAAGSVIVTLVFVYLIMLGVNIYSAVVYSQRLQFVANSAAEAYNQRRFWLGTIRPTWKPEEAERAAKRVASELLNQLDLPPATELSFRNVMGNDYSYTEAKLKVGGLKIPYTVDKVFPSVIELGVTGLAAEASAPPYASFRAVVPIEGQVDAFGRSTTKRYHVAALPSFGFSTGTTALARPFNERPAASGAPGTVVRSDSDIFVSGAILNGATPNAIVGVNAASGRETLLPY